MKLNLQAKIVIGIVALLAAVCLAIGISTVTNVRQQLSTAITEKAKSDTKTSLEIVDLLYPGPWANQNGVLYKGNVKINDNTEIVDKIARLTENTVTVFLHDTRVTTTIIQDGKRAVGTKAADNVIETVLKKEQIYRGEANVLGVKYHANYTPITDVSGRVIGMFYEGVSKQFADELEQGFILNFGGFVFVSLLLSSLLGWYLGRKIARPITSMAGIVEQIADGNLTTHVNLEVTSRDEVGQLAAGFNNMTIQLRKRDEALRQAQDDLEKKVEQRTQELFAMNEELTAMYQDLQEANQVMQIEIADRKKAEEQLEQKNRELGKAYTELKSAQSQLVQQEKLAGIGQLAAGVAHEINNPLGFVLSNFETLQKYVGKLLEVVNAFRELHKRVLEEQIPSLQQEAEQLSTVQRQKKLEYILEDLEPIFRETNDGLNRVSNIVKALRLFSRNDQSSGFTKYDINEGVKTSLTVARNEIKYIAEVKENLADIPAIQAIGGQINQVLLNIILNAAHAIKAKNSDFPGLITISTYADEQFVYCTIEDSGTGIPEEVRKDIFNPFFTTKPVGQGTGLGLSISYDIIVNKHRGEISFISEMGIGTTFIIKLPLIQQAGEAATE